MDCLFRTDDCRQHQQFQHNSGRDDNNGYCRADGWDPAGSATVDEDRHNRYPTENIQTRCTARIYHILQEPCGFSFSSGRFRYRTLQV